MENRELDVMLKQSLQPEVQADESLDREIMEKLQGLSEAESEVGEAVSVRKGMVEGRKRPSRRFLPRAAVIVLAILVAGTGTVYAAGYIYNKIKIADHAVSIGNEDRMIDMVPHEYEGDIDDKLLSTEEPKEGDQWLTKKEEVFGEQLLVTTYTYPDYETSISDTNFESILREKPGKEHQDIIYQIRSIVGNEGCNYSLDAYFAYGNGFVHLNQMMADGGFTEMDVYGVSMYQTGNVRTYLSSSGAEFTLVDDLERKQYTIVMLPLEDVWGCLRFDGLSEEEIHQVLDLVELP